MDTPNAGGAFSTPHSRRIRPAFRAFRRYWARHDVRFHVSGVKRLHDPQVGDMELRYEGLEVVFDADLTIYAYTAEPGTRSAEALALLGSLAATATAEESSPAP